MLLSTGARGGGTTSLGVGDVLVRGAADLSVGTRPAELAAEPAERRASLGNACVDVGARCERDVRGQNGLARSEERLGHSRQVCGMLLPGAATPSEEQAYRDTPHAHRGRQDRCQMGAVPTEGKLTEHADKT